MPLVPSLGLQYRVYPDLSGLQQQSVRVPGLLVRPNPGGVGPGGPGYERRQIKWHARRQAEQLLEELASAALPLLTGNA